MLSLRQLIPPLTTRTLDGQTVRAWDYKQKRNLLIAFLHGECALCRNFASRLASKAAELTERDAVALLVSLDPPQWDFAPNPAIVLASDTTGRSAFEYLGSDVSAAGGLSRVGLFVADRYGELFAQWEARDADNLPPLPDMLKWLAYTQIRCG